MKACTKCNTVKPLGEYHKNKRFKDGHAYRCKPCAIAATNTQLRDVSKSRAKCRGLRKDVINAMKIERGCESLTCSWTGEFTPEQLHFDHIDRRAKNFNIAKAISGGVSLDRLIAEIDNCQVLCANCHARKSKEDKDHIAVR